MPTFVFSVTVIFSIYGNYRYAYEIDIMGRDIRRWYGGRLTEAPDSQAIGVDVDTLHHEVFELPNKNFLTRRPSWSTSKDSRPAKQILMQPWEPYWVVGDQIVEFQPDNGRIVHSLDLLDVLDPQRFGYMLSGF
ncbi:MAG: aryl-sulfate sulfotransferase [Pirellulaceae bacterium]